MRKMLKKSFKQTCSGRTISVLYTDASFDLPNLIRAALNKSSSSYSDDELSDLSDLDGEFDEDDTAGEAADEETPGADDNLTTLEDPSTSGIQEYEQTPHAGPLRSSHPTPDPQQPSHTSQKRKRSSNNAKSRTKARRANKRSKPAIEHSFVHPKPAAAHIRAASILPESLDGAALPTTSTAFQAIRQQVEKVAWRVAELLNLGFRYQQWDGR